jgi:hypothetical protein
MHHRQNPFDPTPIFYLTFINAANTVFWGIKMQLVPHRKHITSPTEPSLLMRCKILGFHGGDYEECRLVGCYVMSLL